MAPSSSLAPASPGSCGRAGGHVRSASVPWQAAALMQVEEQLAALRWWTSHPGQNALSLAHVRALLCVLDELLQLPLAHAALLRDDSLLHGFLVLADAFASFLAALLALRHHAADLRAAVRRRDPAKLASAARAQRQLARELEHLGAAVARDAARSARAALSSTEQRDDVVRTVAEAINDIALASASVFVQVADAAAALAAPPASQPKKQRLPLVNASSSSRSRTSCFEEPTRALDKLQELEQCIGELESESEKVFRSLVQTRVSLLNIHTPTF